MTIPASTVPSAPDFGAPCPIAPSAPTLELMASRRSASAQTLGGEGPDAAQLSALLRLAARAPDHGKMTPWRFVVLREHKAAFVEGLRRLVPHQPNPDKAQASLAKIAAPPVAVAVLSTAREGAKPVWEQELSAGAVCMNLLLAAHAMGFGANWITDWYGYDRDALALLGARDGERLAGWIMLGEPGEAPLERVRPDMATLVREWRG